MQVNAFVSNPYNTGNNAQYRSGSSGAEQKAEQRLPIDRQSEPSADRSRETDRDLRQEQRVSSGSETEPQQFEKESQENTARFESVDQSNKLYASNSRQDSSENSEARIVRISTSDPGQRAVNQYQETQNASVQDQLAGIDVFV